MEEAIRKILAENSGGVKFNVILCELISQDPGIAKDPNIDIVDLIISTIDNMPDVEILRYGYLMGGELWREKHFVHTPMPQ